MTCSSSRAQAAAADLAGSLTGPPAASVTDSSQSPQSLASGAAGVALLHATRARSGCGDWPTAHAWLSAAARHDPTADADASLFFGVPALAFVAHTAAHQPGKLRQALAALDANTTAVTRQRLTAAHMRMDRGEYPALAEFDLIRGLTGLGVYHLRRHPHHDVTKAVLTYLVRLTEPSSTGAGELPGWWTNLDPTGQASSDFPGGHANIGMAHGIAGPLALLSLALRHDVVVDGHTDAIARICAWLDEWQQHDSGSWWPYWVTRAQLRGDSPVLGPGRPSWCYGTAGLARAQQLAGLATGDTARQRIAETALVGCLSDPAQLTKITDLGLCHGLAGLTHTAWRMAADALTPDIAAFLPELHETLLTQARSTGGEQEFLTGTAGVALALHTAGIGAIQSADWDACLLLV